MARALRAFLACTTLVFCLGNVVSIGMSALHARRDFELRVREGTHFMKLANQLQNAKSCREAIPEIQNLESLKIGESVELKSLAQNLAWEGPGPLNLNLRRNTKTQLELRVQVGETKRLIPLRLDLHCAVDREAARFQLGEEIPATKECIVPESQGFAEVCRQGYFLTPDDSKVEDVCCPFEI